MTEYFKTDTQLWERIHSLEGMLNVALDHIMRLQIELDTKEKLLEAYRARHRDQSGPHADLARLLQGR